MNPLKVGDPISVRIEKLVDGGAGLARWEGRAVFVPGACPGEEVRARVTAVRSGYAEAQLQNILTPSPDRVSPPCPVFGSCGGCQWQQMAYPAQVRAKTEILQEDLRRIGRIPDAALLPALSAPDPLEYRSRIQLKMDLSSTPIRIGFHEGKSHRIVTIEDCRIAASPLNRALSVIKDLLTRHPEHRLETMTDLHLQWAAGTGEFQARYFAGEESPGRVDAMLSAVEAALPEAVGQIYYGRNGRRVVRGRDYLIDRYRGLDFRIGDRAFAQVHSALIPALIETVLAFAGLTGRESVIELYCGIGTFGIFLAREAAALEGYDENTVAVEDAAHNAKRLGLTHCRFTAQAVRRAVSEQAVKKTHFDCVILDPPREGVDRKILETLIRLKPARIVYVSCNPATLARDLKILIQTGFRLGRIQPIDLFPQTYHLETVAELTAV